jgi:hypothetical protein
MFTLALGSAAYLAVVQRRLTQGEKEWAYGPSLEVEGGDTSMTVGN